MKLVRAAVLVACGAIVAGANPAAAQQAATKAALSPELQKVKAALEKYQDPIVAVRDGYLSTQACVGYSDGNMGIHFVNMAHVAPTVDPRSLRC